MDLLQEHILFLYMFHDIQLCDSVIFGIVFLLAVALLIKVFDTKASNFAFLDLQDI